MPIGSDRKTSAVHPTCATMIVQKYVRCADRRCGSCLEARSHWKAIGTRITM